jgi:cytosine/adenosine deaminase-related metal-dependent hydrolase
MNSMNEPLLLMWAAKIADGTGFQAAPGAVLLRGDRVIATGRPEELGRPADAALLDCRNSVVTPALVNAHCHLDLSHIGPIPLGGGFVDWVNFVRARRARSPSEIAEAVRQGVKLSRAGGTAIIGDIAGNRSMQPLAAVRESGLAGVSYLEVFGLGASQDATCEYLRQASRSVSERHAGVLFGLQPHAPYSCGLKVYQTAVDLELPLATHLAETTEELQFVANATGPLRDMLIGIGVWDDTIVGHGSHPLEALAEVLQARPLIAAHLNYIDDQHLEVLAGWSMTIAYCPRASSYFGHEGHRYVEMLDAGINVALGTDSILCLDTPDRISVLDDMRLLHRRDGTDPITLLRMATISGAKALGFNPDLVTLTPGGGTKAGLLALPIDGTDTTDPLKAALLNDEPPQWIMGPVPGKDSWICQ